MTTTTSPVLGLLPHPLPDAPGRLARLTAEALRQAELSHHDCPAWVDATSRHDTPVLVVGAGQAGLATTHGLRRRGIADVMVVDAAQPGLTGPWRTFARMKTLRTPKDITWPTWGVPAASPQAWFEARYGRPAWDDLEHFPTSDWQDFLDWYRTALALPVRFGTTLLDIQGGHDGTPFSVTLAGPDGTEHVTAQRIVLATGLEGAGGRRVPHELFADLPVDRWAHTHDDIDFSRFQGCRVGVLGGGTGAFDNAATALEAGAALADVHLRRAAVPTVSPYRWMEFPGLLDHYATFSDEQKWAFNVHLARVDQPPTQNAVWRAHAHPAFSFHVSSPWQQVTWDGREVIVRTPRGEHRYDVVIAATGITVDLGGRPELASVQQDIARWGDVLPPSVVAQAPALAGYPYLDEHFGCTSRDGAPDGRLSRIHLFNHGARVSNGVLSHQISGLAGGVQRLVTGITGGFFRENASGFLAEYLAYDTPVPLTWGPRPSAAGRPPEAVQGA